MPPTPNTPTVIVANLLKPSVQSSKANTSFLHGHGSLNRNHDVIATKLRILTRWMSIPKSSLRVVKSCFFSQVEAKWDPKISQTYLSKDFSPKKKKHTLGSGSHLFGEFQNGLGPGQADFSHHDPATAQGPRPFFSYHLSALY